MVFAAPSIPYVPPPATTHTVVTQGVATETGIGGIPLHTVPSAIAAAEARNNYRNPAPVAGRGGNAVPAAAAASPSSAAARLAALASPGSTLDFSSPFFAQLSAQTPLGLRPGLLHTFTPVRYNTAAPQTMEVFSQVKYLPSHAAKPRPPAPDFAGVKAAPLPDLKQNFAQAQAQLRNDQARGEGIRLPAAATAAQNAAALPVAATPLPAAAGNPATLRREGDRPAEETKTETNQRRRGINAYLEALSRNATIKPVAAVEKT